MNPDDTEEAIWAFLCEAQLTGAADARRRFLQVRSWASPDLNPQNPVISGLAMQARFAGAADAKHVRALLAPHAGPLANGQGWVAAQGEGLAVTTVCTRQVGRDSRPIMRAAYECFKAGSDPERILAAAEGDRNGHDRFYAQLVGMPRKPS